MTAALNRDQLIALMVAERDAERLGRGEVRPLEWPDAENRLAKAVEFRGVDDVGEIVVEHTRIESYDSQIDDRMAVSKIFPKFGPEIPEIHTIFEGTSEIQQLVIARAISGMRIE